MEKDDKTSYRYLNEQKSKFGHIKKKNNQLIVLSQGNDIAEKFLEHYDRFKLHPGEFDRWQNYPALKKLIDNVEIPLYILFAESRGIFYSTI